MMSCTNNEDAPLSFICIPEELKTILLQFSAAYLTEEPKDTINFAVKFFRALKYSRTKEIPPTSQDWSILDDYCDSKKSSRHRTIFSESYDTSSEKEIMNTTIIPKTPEQMKRLKESVKTVLLFRSLQVDQMNEVLQAMHDLAVKKWDLLIRQGDVGDNFYVIENGKFNVIIDDEIVHTFNNKGYFGEIALLYNVQRTASVMAITDGMLWVLDRITFRRIVMKSAFRQRKFYGTLLEKVPLLQDLDETQRTNLCDALQVKYYRDDDMIIKQGDDGDGMYFIERGMVIVKYDDLKVDEIGVGGYFGELALITNRPRIASVYSKGPTKLAFLEKESFERILGFLAEDLKKNIDVYERNWKRTVMNE